MNRVCVLGPPGSGKSSVARALGEIYALPVTHLDVLFWRPGWVEPDRDEFNARVREVIARERWIIDGNYRATLPERIERTDLIVFLDLPRRVTLPRILVRRIQHHGKTRPDIAAGCAERIDLEFLNWARRWRLASRPNTVAMLHAHAAEDRLVTLSSRAQVATFLARARTNTTPP